MLLAAGPVTRIEVRAIPPWEGTEYYMRLEVPYSIRP